MLFGIARHQAAAVDQDQRALRARGSEDRLRRYRVAPFETPEVCAAPTDGSWLRTSSMRVEPESLTSWSETTVTGAADSRFGCGMREPVTMMSWPD